MVSSIRPCQILVRSIGRRCLQPTPLKSTTRFPFRTRPFSQSPTLPARQTPLRQAQVEDDEEEEEGEGEEFGEEGEDEGEEEDEDEGIDSVQGWMSEFRGGNTDTRFKRDLTDIEPDIPAVPGFFADGEPGVDHLDDEDWDWDDISSSAHGELEQVREVREFYRIAAWDMPMLYQHAKPFQPPTEKTPLRFRYTTYLGETHPGSAKVVMDFQPAKLPNLTNLQRDKLIKLLGTRYNPHTATAKMSCERYPTAPQNKNHVVETLERLLKEAREGKDTFEDVPFDFRHAGPKKKKLKFPEAWVMNKDKELLLSVDRQARLEDELAREKDGLIVDGKKAMGLDVAQAEQPEMMIAVRRKKQ